MKITQEEFDEWQRSPVSVAFFNWLKGVNEGAEAEWVDQLAKPYIHPDNLSDTRAQLRARKQVASVIASVSYEDIRDEQTG